MVLDVHLREILRFFVPLPRSGTSTVYCEVACRGNIYVSLHDVLSSILLFALVVTEHDWMRLYSK